MKQRSVFITGTSKGLGVALAEHYLKLGADVYGISRSGSDLSHPQFHEIRLDMADLDGLSVGLDSLFKRVDSLDLVILNAGILGDIQLMHELEMKALNQLMDINVWSNKLLLDFLCRGSIEVGQIVAISSGAAVNGNKGWGAYSLSKATLNMLIKLYAAEYPSIHFTSLAPGLVDTQMQDYLCNPAQVDEAEFPSVAKLRQARGSAAMPTPELAAVTIAGVLPSLKTTLVSGEFIDMRNL